MDNNTQENKEPDAKPAPAPLTVPAEAGEPDAEATAPKTVEPEPEKPIEVLAGEAAEAEAETGPAKTEEEPAETPAGETAAEEQPEMPEPEPEPEAPKPQEPPAAAPKSAPAITAKPVLGFWDKLKEIRARANRVRTKKKEENLAKVLAYAREHNRITNDEAQEITGVCDERATEYLNILVKKGDLVRFGKTSNIFYKPTSR